METENFCQFAKTRLLNKTLKVVDVQIVLQQVKSMPSLKNNNNFVTFHFKGDVRANEHWNLVLMHTVWMREHNRIAGLLFYMHPDWNDEKLFQEARRIAIAEYQHIVYGEWLPVVLGSDSMSKYGLWPLSEGYSDAYKGRCSLNGMH